MKYHVEIGFPKTLILSNYFIWELKYTNHALESSRNDRYGKIQLPSSLTIDKINIIEVETEDNIYPNKLLLRVPYDDIFDLSIVLIPTNNLVKTVWLNKKTDKHKTLKHKEYTKIC